MRRRSPAVRPDGARGRRGRSRRSRRRAAHLPTWRGLELVGDRRVVASQCGEMVADRMAGDALMVAATEGRRQTEMGGAGRLPKTRFLGPVGLGAGAHRHPYLDPDLGGVTAGFFG